MIEVDAPAPGVTRLRLAAPPHNLLSRRMIDRLNLALDEAPGGDALLVTAHGRSFSSGFDLDELAGLSDAGVHDLLTEFERLLRRLFFRLRPVVSALDGHAIAGGCLLALTADRTLMSAGRLGLPEAKLALPLPPMSFEIARYSLGSSADRLLLSGELLEVGEATALGIVEFCPAEQLEETGVDLARSLAQVEVGTFTRTKQALRAPSRLRVRDQVVGSELLAEWLQARSRLGTRNRAGRG